MMLPSPIPCLPEQTPEGTVLCALQNGEGARSVSVETESSAIVFSLWVRTSHAWRFVTAKDRPLPGKRYVLVNGSYEAYRRGAGWRLTGSPAMVCDRIPH